MKPRDLVVRVLYTLGVEVGDYGRGDLGFLLRTSDGLRQLRLEGWGPDCVPGEGRLAAYQGAAKLAKQWSQIGLTAGVIPTAGDAWFVTYGLSGRLVDAAEDQFDDEDIIDLVS